MRTTFIAGCRMSPSPKLSLMLSVAIAICCTGLAVAEVRVQEAETSITGRIKPEDFRELAKVAQRVAPNTRWNVSLNSPGGDLATSLRMGRLLRERQASVNVGARSICLSACVFLLAGGVERSVQSHLGAVVGIHRPYDPADSAVTPEAQREKQLQWEREIRAFLDYVNIAPELYSRMLRVSPDEVRKLSMSELRDLGLAGNDPYWNDAQETARAAALSISKAEYLARKAKAAVVCPSLARPGKLFDDLICESNVLRGLPPRQGFD